MHSPSRESAPAARNTVEQDVIREYAAAREGAPMSTGRGGIGNISQESSRSRSRPAAAVYSTGRGGAGNIISGDARRPEQIDVEARRHTVPHDGPYVASLMIFIPSDASADTQPAAALPSAPLLSKANSAHSRYSRSSGRPERGTASTAFPDSGYSSCTPRRTRCACTSKATSILYAFVLICGLSEIQSFTYLLHFISKFISIIRLHIGLNSADRQTDPYVNSLLVDYAVQLASDVHLSTWFMEC